jgi:hypothetical protein
MLDSAQADVERNRRRREIALDVSDCRGGAHARRSAASQAAHRPICSIVLPIATDIC